MRSQKRAARARSWETSSAPRPAVASSRTSASTCNRCSRSRNAVGSSSSSSCGSWQSARATSASCRSPPESSSTERSASSRIPSRSRAERARSTSARLSNSKAPRCGVRPISTTSATRKGNGTAVCWGTTATVRASSRRRQDAIARPATVTRPRSDVQTRLATRTTLVLPAPLRPTSPSTSPARTSRLTPSRIVRPPRRTPTSWSARSCVTARRLAGSAGAAAPGTADRPPAP